MRTKKKLLIMEELLEQNTAAKLVKFDGAATNVSTAQKLGCNYNRGGYYFKYIDREMYAQLDARTCSRF